MDYSHCNAQVEFTEVMKLYSKLIFVGILASVGNINPALAAPEPDTTVAALATSAPSIDLNAAVNLDRPVEQLEPSITALDQTAPTLVARRAPRKSKVKSRRPQPKPVKAPAASPAEPAATSEQPTTPAGKKVLITEIDVQGSNAPLSADLRAKVLQAITSKVGQTATSEQLQKDVNAIQALGAFEAVKVQPQQSGKGVKLTYLVSTFGVLRQVSIQTLPAGTTSVFSQTDLDTIFKDQYGQTLNAASLQEGVKKLNQLYKEKGYELAQVVNIENLSADGKLQLTVAEGIIEDVKVQFLNKDRKPVDDKGQPVTGSTREFIITREAESKPGKVYNRKMVEKDLRRIFGLGLFEDLGLTFVPGKDDPSKVVLQINVIERKTGSIVAGGGVSSSNGLFGSLSYQEQNLGGNAQKIGGEIQLGTRELLFDANFTDPWIGGDPNRTSYTLNLFQRRSISLVFDGGPSGVFLPPATNREVPRVVRAGGGITFSRPLNGDPYGESAWRASAGLQYQKVSIQDNAGATATVDSAGQPLSFSGTGQDDLLLVQLGLSQDLRNSATDPTQGSLFRVGVDQSIPIGAASISLTRLRGSFTQYVPVSLINLDKGSQAFVFNVQGGTVLGDIPPYEAFSLGGVTSVRGYDDGAVGSGKSFLQASAEYRFPIISILGGTFFADYGTDLGTGREVPGNPAGTRGKPGSGFGYGAGVRINSPLGPLRLDFGLNDRGESRIQFGIAERF
jgi:outer membrane protein insertion porin family